MTNIQPKLALINVVYENYTVLDDFLKSLRNQSNKNFHLFLIDLSENKKNILDIYKSTINNHQSTIITGINKGYSYGVNIGLRKAISDGFKYFCVINNDVYFKENLIKDCLNSIIKHPASIIGGKIYYAPGYEYHKHRYKKSDLGKVLWYAGGLIDWNHALTPHIGVDEVDHGQFNSFKEVDFVNGALMLLDKSVVHKAGFWNESYFLYFEDADFCVRAQKVGIKLFYDPSLVIWHKNAQSTGGSGSKIHLRNQKINQLRFGLKYAPLTTKFHLLKNYVLGS